MNEAHLSKALADLASPSITGFSPLLIPRLLTVHHQGGHYHRSDLVRLLVDTRRKDPITHFDGDSIVHTKTIDRVGLSKPLVVTKGEASPGGQEAKASNGGASDFIEVK